MAKEKILTREFEYELEFDNIIINKIRKEDRKLKKEQLLKYTTILDVDYLYFNILG